MQSSELDIYARQLRSSAHSVLFVTSQLRPRELKMADGLRRAGWTVGLIYSNWTPFVPAEHFDFSIEVNSPEEAHECSMKLRPRLTHVFSGAIDDYVLLLCRDKPSRVVIDLNDVFAPSLFDYCHERFEPTREALALADGFCARDLQVKSAQHADGFEIPRHVILYPEYCWDRGNDKGHAPDGQASKEIHVVSVGTFSLETQQMYDSCYLKLAQMLVGHEIHFHIYPHWAYRPDHSGSPHARFEHDFADFLALERESPFLHVHASLPLDELALTLPQFDFGIVSGGCTSFGQRLGFYYPAYMRTCYSGRISDYLDAGLPVLINDEVKFDYWLLMRYGVGIDLKQILAPGFKEKLIESKNDPRRHAASKRAARALSVDVNIARLAHFYEKIVASEFRPKPRREALRSHDVAESAPDGAQLPTRLIPIDQIRTRAVSAYRRLRRTSPNLSRMLHPIRTIRNFEKKLEELHFAHAQAVSGYDAVRTQVDAALPDTGERLKRLETIEQDRADLGSRLGELERARAKHEARLDNICDDHDALFQRVSEVSSANDSFRNAVEDTSSRLESLAGALTTLAAKLADAESRLRVQEELANELSTKVEKHTHLTESAPIGSDARAEDPDGRNRTAESELRAQLDRLSAQVRSLKEENHRLSNEKFVLQQERKLGNVSIHDLAGILNWPEILRDAERTNGCLEFLRLFRLFGTSEHLASAPSACWDALAAKNFDQLLTEGYKNFKRTIGGNYFNFMIQGGDPQLASLETLLSVETIARCRDLARRIPDDPSFGLPNQEEYRYFVLLIWEFAGSIDKKSLLGSLSEPTEGNPLAVTTPHGIASQDLANSLIEYYSISEAIDMTRVRNMLEIGGGYGRHAFVHLATNPALRTTLVDIMPALYIAQRYLSSVFPGRKVFRAREFSSYDDVRDEMEGCSIVFLMPHQLELMPARYYDLGINISSFGEMGLAQIEWYFARLGQLIDGAFYNKQWRISRNVFDGTEIKEDGYPVPAHWKLAFSRPCAVQTDFFEAIYHTKTP